MSYLLENLSSALGLLGAIVTWLYVYRANKALKNYESAVQNVQQRSKRKQTPNLRSLVRFADFFGLHTRKAIKALAGDFSAEVQRLKRARRPHMARWNVCLAWLYTFWIVAKAPMDMLLRYLVKAFGGIGK